MININGSRYTVQLSDQYDQLIEQLGLNVVPKQAALDIKAPMPGIVLDIMVKNGQTVEEGTPILILEAMKMENVLKAAAPGLVDTIEVKKGIAVEKGQLLVKIQNMMASGIPLALSILLKVSCVLNLVVMFLK